MENLIKTSEFEIKNLTLINNRAKTQIIRRFEEYKYKKLNYHIKSGYAKHLIDNQIINCQNIFDKRKILPLISSFVVTDGYISKRKKKNIEVFELGFANLNLELINAFNDLIYLAYNVIPSSLDQSRIKRTRFVASWHKSMIEEIKNYCYLNNQKTIKNLLNSDKSILLECLRIALSCDGFISCYTTKEKYGYKDFDFYARIRPELALGCKPLNLRTEWFKLTEKIDLSFLMKNDRIKCNSWKIIKNFHELGGFIPNTFIGKDSKRHEGLDKNFVLKNLLDIKNKSLNNLILKSKESNNLKLLIEVIK